MKNPVIDSLEEAKSAIEQGEYSSLETVIDKTCEPGTVRLLVRRFVRIAINYQELESVRQENIIRVLDNTIKVAKKYGY